MSEYNQTVERNREEGSIGIGAMIVFIALILVAAVASTIIIKTAEELQQNAESTSDDTRKEISGKVNIIQIIVNGTGAGGAGDLDSLIVTAKIASGSTDVQVQDIEWLIVCGGTTMGLVTGNLGTTDAGGGAIAAPESYNADKLDGSDWAATDELPAGTTFKFDINLDPAGDNTGSCATVVGVGETIELKMIVDGGGTTISELQIESVVSGKEVT
jgi:flagellin FlaB